MIMERVGRPKGLLLIGCVVACLGLPANNVAQWKAKDTEWPSYAADLAGTRYRPLDQINAANFNDLEIAWRIKTDNFGNRPEYKLEGTPLMVNGVLYATADYAHGVQALSQTQIEERVAELIRPSRVAIGGSTSFARAACLMQNGVPQSSGSTQALFVMRWQDSDLSHLPKQLADQLVSGRYRAASVGSCEPAGVDGTFTAYRVAVLLY